tara:strand:+ start:2372 stop:2554 length:183 start_codon:yes stop_codon:yes gene_type:complete
MGWKFNSNKINMKEQEIQKLYEQLMVLAHNIEDKLHYNETPRGKKWGKIVNKLQDFNKIK